MTAVHPTSDLELGDRRHRTRGTVLLVEDDSSTVELFRRALEHAGFAVLTSTTGESAMSLVHGSAIELVVVDLHLPDMSGLEFIRQTFAEGQAPPFILVSAFLTITISVEAMRLGAFDVLEKPIEIQRLIEAVQAGVRTSAGGRRAESQSKPIHLPPVEGHYGSAAHRWAMYVVKACEAERDLRTLQDWAKHAGVSYSTLCESCRILSIQPQAARDFTRALRAVIKSASYQCDPAALLDVGDRRTLRVLLERAGPSFRSGGLTTIHQFVREQRFVIATNEGIRVLLGYFESHPESSAVEASPSS